MWPTCGAGSRGAIVAREDGGFLRSEHAASVTRRGEAWLSRRTPPLARAGAAARPVAAEDGGFSRSEHAAGVTGRGRAWVARRIARSHVQIALTIERSAML